MPIQSYLMMYFAGAGWQIGKRKISAIPNEEFNKMSANDLLQGFTADLRGSIPTLESSLKDISPLISVLIEQYGDFARTLLTEVPVVSKDVLFGDQGIFSPTQTGNKALIDDINKALGGNPTQAQFLAYAKILLQREADKQALLLAGSQQASFTPPTGLGPSTISGLTVGQAQAQAIEKQRQFELAEAKRISDFNKLKSQVGTPPIAPQVPKDFKFKAKAGQSQIMERLRLIKLIAQLGKDSKFLDAEPARKHAFNRMLFEQQQLVNLLARYNFD